jgi:hypothetical protein
MISLVILPTYLLSCKMTPPLRSHIGICLLALALALRLLGGQAEVVQYTTGALADQVDADTLPGASALDINFNQFSGYLTGI